LSYDLRNSQSSFNKALHNNFEHNISIDISPFRYNYFCNCSSIIPSHVGSISEANDLTRANHSIGSCPEVVLDGLLEFGHVYAHVFLALGGATIGKHSIRNICMFIVRNICMFVDILWYYINISKLILILIFLCFTLDKSKSDYDANKVIHKVFRLTQLRKSKAYFSPVRIVLV
jgi:hypothetical protein